MLKRKNISLGTDTARRLGITVTEAKVNTGEFSWEYYATVKVHLGDGQHYDFSGFNIGAARCIGCNLSQAINEALIQMFRNTDILAYLQK